MVIFDARIPASRAFAQSACLSGILACESKGDAGALWYNTIGPALRRGPCRLVGLTLASDLFLLTLLAADVGMKVLFREPCGAPESLVSWAIVGGTDDACRTKSGS